MTHEERTHVTEAVIEAAAGRIGVFPHTGAQSTAETIELSVHAQKAGAKGLMIVPPYYDPLSIPALHAHLAAVGGEAHGHPLGLGGAAPAWAASSWAWRWRLRWA